jgi:ABC-type multidrug transport system fused ATPase/permease subunit
MLALSSFLKPYRSVLLLVLVLALGQAVSNLYLPNLMANIVDNGIVKNDPGYIWTTGSLMLLVSLGGIVCALVGIFFASRMATSFGKVVRASIFSHVARFSLGEFDRVSAASLITHTTNDTTQIQGVLVTLLNVMITAPITLVGGIVLAINQDVGLAWIFVVVLPLLIAAIVLLMRRTIPLFSVIQTRLDKINLILSENMTGVRVIRAFNRNRYEEQRFDLANLDLTRVAHADPVVCPQCLRAGHSLVWGPAHRTGGDAGRSSLCLPAVCYADSLRFVNGLDDVCPAATGSRLCRACQQGAGYRTWDQGCSLGSACAPWRTLPGIPAGELPLSRCAGAGAGRYFFQRPARSGHCHYRRDRLWQIDPARFDPTLL